VVFDQERDSQVLTGFVGISEKTSQSKNLPYNYVYFRGWFVCKTSLNQPKEQKTKLFFLTFVNKTCVIFVPW